MTNHCILYVEDDLNDVFFLQHAFAAANIANSLQIVKDGQEAIDYLTGVGQFADRQKFPLPHLVLLDFQLPHRSGLEILVWLKTQPALRTLPVIMLTSAANPRYTDKATALGANACVVKPMTLEKQREFVESLKSAWLTGP